MTSGRQQGLCLQRRFGYRVSLWDLWGAMGQGFLKKIAIDYPNVERLFNGFKSLDLLLKLPKWYPVPRVWFTTITTKTLKEKEIFYILFYIHISIFWMANKKKPRKAFSKQCWYTFFSWCTSNGFKIRISTLPHSGSALLSGFMTTTDRNKMFSERQERLLIQRGHFTCGEKSETFLETP